MSTPVEQIKSRLTISDVIGSYITLEKSGANLKARCPFHNEKTPSFFISPDRNNYYCFGCGAKGDIFSFVQEFESLDFVGAIKVLAERAGVPLEEYRKVKGVETNEFERIYLATEEACIFFQKNLSKNQEALIYLKNRGLKIETVRDWRVGFATADWRTLKEYLEGRGFSESELLKAGLIKEKEGGSSYDRFRGRIMFPIFDSSGRVIAFSGRILHEKKDEEVTEPKYLNSPETSIFEKSKTLYGMQIAKYKIKENYCAILVEGQIDLLMSHQAGFSNTIASSGTALTPEHVTLIKRYTDKLVIAYDGDKAGQSASLRAWQLSLLAGLDVEVVLIEGGKDPADSIKEDASRWKEALDKSEHIVDFYLKIIKDKKDKEREVIVTENILPLIASIEGSSGKSKYITKLSFATGVPEKQIWEDLAKIEVLSEVVSATKADKKPDQLNGVESLSDNVKKTLSLIYLFSKTKGAEAEVFINKVERILPKINDLIKEHEDKKDVLIFQAESCFGNAPNEVASNEILHYLEEDILKGEFSKIMYALKVAEGNKDENEINKNAEHLNDISKKLSTLNKKTK